MSTITLADVQYVAALAKIAVTEDEATKLQSELSAIISYVAQLDQLNTDGVEPTYQVTGLTNVTRKDELIDYDVSQADLLKNASAVQDHQLKVPKVL